jgi:acetoin:2,6-dichlorophenolindophenol oxidoreductase subunit alpha
VESKKEDLVWMYSTMVLIREYEETMAKVYMEGKLPPNIQKGLAFDIGAGPVPGEMHLSAGQEPVAVGVCAHLRKEDTVVGAHRSHHFAIAKGVRLNEMTAEMFGKVTGLSRGKGGHMHLFDPEYKFSCSGIVGASLPPACGAALAAKKRGNDNVAVAFFGEGAANQGAFHESLNLASVWKLPVVFICEDNKYAISVEKVNSTSVEWNTDRASGYKMMGIPVIENDAIQVYEAADTAIQRARLGAGPTLIEVKTDRYLGHFQGDPEVYRAKDETKELRKNDPIPKLGEYLTKQGYATEEDKAEIVKTAKEKVAEAFEFGRTSPYPDPEEALSHVFA